MRKTALALAVATALTSSGCGSNDRDVVRDKYRGKGDCEREWGRGKCEMQSGGGFFYSPYYYSGFRSDSALVGTNSSVGSTAPIRSSLAPTGSKIATPKSGFSGSSSSVKTGGFGKSGSSFSSFGG